MAATSLQTNYTVKTMLERYNSNVITIAPLVVKQHPSQTYYQSLPAAPIVVQPTQQRQNKCLLQFLCVGLTGIVVIIIIARLIANS
jgi:hypothetical protein